LKTDQLFNCLVCEALHTVPCEAVTHVLCSVGSHDHEGPQKKTQVSRGHTTLQRDFSYCWTPSSRHSWEMPEMCELMLSWDKKTKDKWMI